MTDDSAHRKAEVGAQLARRREDLDLVQADLARRVGITVTTVSAIERGRNEIRRSKRAIWERSLGLRVGTISRAYRDGAELEPEDGPEPLATYANMNDPHERTVWEMEGLPDKAKRHLIDAIRKEKRALERERETNDSLRGQAS